MFSKWIKEIKAVGFRDWWWFVVKLERDEFSKKLNAEYYFEKYGFYYQAQMIKERKKAHEISIKLSNLDKEV